MELIDINNRWTNTSLCICGRQIVLSLTCVAWQHLSFYRRLLELVQRLREAVSHFWVARLNWLAFHLLYFLVASIVLDLLVAFYLFTPCVVSNVEPSLVSDWVITAVWIGTLDVLACLITTFWSYEVRFSTAFSGSCDPRLDLTQVVHSLRNRIFWHILTVVEDFTRWLTSNVLILACSTSWDYIKMQVMRHIVIYGGWE